MTKAELLEHFQLMESYIPEGLDLLSLKGFVLANAVVFSFIIVRYILMVAPFYYHYKNQIQTRKLKPDQIRFEIKYSVLSTIFFGLSAYVMGVCWQQGWTQIYLRYTHYPLWYLPLSFLVYSFLHEIYFYWTHLWMHRPSVYKKVHHVHHYSVNTTPWASFSFHPYECLIHAAFLPLMVLVIPIHPVVLISYLVFMTLTAISNHLGVELIAFKSVRRHFISGQHHALHHLRFNGNYGLYYCFMDRFMKTELPEE